MNEKEIGKMYAARDLKPTDLPGALTKRTKPKAKATAKQEPSAAERRETAKKESRAKGELFIGGSLESEAKLDSDAYREKMANSAAAEKAPKPTPPDPAIAAAKALTDAQNELVKAKEHLAAVNEKISLKTRERQRALDDINFVDVLGSIERTLEQLRGSMHNEAVTAVARAKERVKLHERNAPSITTEADTTRRRWVALATNLLIDEQKRVAEVKAQHARSIQQCNAELERYSVNAKAWEAKVLATGGKAAVVQGKKEISDYWKGLR